MLSALAAHAAGDEGCRRQPLASIVLHWLLFPVLWDRFFIAHYLVSSVLSVRMIVKQLDVAPASFRADELRSEEVA